MILVSVSRLLQLCSTMLKPYYACTGFGFPIFATVVVFLTHNTGAIPGFFWGGGGGCTEWP